MQIVMTALGGAAFVGLISAGIWFHWRHWRSGPDQPWSNRLAAASTALFGVWILVGGVIAATGQVPHNPVLARAIVLAVIPAGGFFLVAQVARWRETQQAKRRDAELGRPVPRRLLPPWMVVVLWLVATFLSVVGGTFLAFWASYPQPLPTERIQTLVQVVTIAGVVLAAAHAAAQSWRRHREQRRVQADTERWMNDLRRGEGE